MVLAPEDDPVQVQWASGGGELENPTAQALRANAEHSYQFTRHGMAVRRLTPIECERLQGMPDDHTRIAITRTRHKAGCALNSDDLEVQLGGCDCGAKPKVIPAEECPDGPRYRAIGNSMAVPVIAWIGRQIEKAFAKAGS
jgi:DNA (cytosine-5)-methyltransferase 1